MSQAAHSSAMDDRDHSRNSPRVKVEFGTLYSEKRVDGSAVLVDISYSGAHFKEATVKPKIGATVQAYIFLSPGQPIELVGEVVRHEDDGFAVVHDMMDEEMRNLVDDLQAMVSPPKA